MKVTYSPGEGDVQTWDFEPDDVPQSQAEMVEKRYGGQNWDQWLTDVRQGSARARRVLLWHLLRQTHHTLRFEDTPDFRMGQVRVDSSLPELRIQRERAAKMPGLSDDDRELVLAALDQDIADLEAAEADDAPAGKEPSPTS